MLVCYPFLTLLDRLFFVKCIYTQHPTLVDSVTASKEDLAELAKLLRSKLDQLKKDERQMGVSLAELKAKIQADLKKVEARMKNAK